MMNIYPNNGVDALWVLVRSLSIWYTFPLSPPPPHPSRLLLQNHETVPLFALFGSMVHFDQQVWTHKIQNIARQSVKKKTYTTSASTVGIGCANNQQTCLFVGVLNCKFMEGKFIISG